jgi:catechol 2,3-dioxygenase
MEVPIAVRSISKVTLIVHELAAVSAFYQRVLGLRRLSGDAGSAMLGAGAALLELRQDAAARRHAPGEAGLYHTAFLLPARADLGRWLRHAGETGVRLQGSADHLVSEAVYLADPEGNGIEIYVDRPRDAWRWRDGQVQMANQRLDFEGLLAAAGEGGWNGAPDGTVIGHVHLQVGAIAPAEAFYQRVLGLPVTCRFPGATFYGAKGYHHHIATNIWNSGGAAPRRLPATGLAGIEMIGAGPAALRDPWGTEITVTGG